MCAYICHENKIKLFDILKDGIRPIFDSNDCVDCQDCLSVCPGFSIELKTNKSDKIFISELFQRFGPITEIWEGYAADPQIRFNGSSGGVITAFAQYCIEKEDMYGTLHIGSDPEAPWKNQTVFSKSREELLARTGSRYSPASTCDGLKRIEESPSSCVFIGKPCDIAGLRKAQNLRSALNLKVGVAIGFFCAGTPSTQGTLDFLKSYHIETENVAELRYRGKGWPGMATVKFKTDIPPIQVTYEDSWGFIQKYRPFRCYLCPDLTGEYSDISFGDPWYRKRKEGDDGYSLILVRNEKGRDLFHKAINAGYVIAKRVDPEILNQSQENLLRKRQTLWGRLLAMKVLGIPIPNLEGFHLFENWLELSRREKVRTILGTVRRIIQRKYFLPLRFDREVTKSN